MIRYRLVFHNLFFFSFVFLSQNSFKDCDLHSLDLRLCNFIGKECVDTDFSNSLCNDACFVPLESETPNFFAISENGKYFATGNKSAVNIWDVKYSTVIHRVLSDESSPFTDIGYKKDTGFVISANSELYSSVITMLTRKHPNVAIYFDLLIFCVFFIFNFLQVFISFLFFIV